MHRQNEKIWNKTSVLIPNAPICDGFKCREWLYKACWYFSWYWRVFIACKLWELNRGVRKAFREQNHLRLHTRLTSEKQLFVCLFPHLFSTFYIEIWWWRAAWTRGKQMSLPHREEFDMPLNCPPGICTRSRCPRASGTRSRCSPSGPDAPLHHTGLSSSFETNF